MVIEYKLTFKSHHLKYFNIGVWTFLSELKKELKKTKFNKIVRLPKKTKHFTVIKSPVRDKSHREQFKIDSYKLQLSLAFKIPRRSRITQEESTLMIEYFFEEHVLTKIPSFIHVQYVKSFLEA